MLTPQDPITCSSINAHQVHDGALALLTVAIW
jgi:hypothetical protein